ncbi:MAG: hypothetical protein IH953_07155 [Chloroflexi bacterium]|nr:hypothetical protein [Chloroflexota bacterium]
MKKIRKLTLLVVFLAIAGLVSACQSAASDPAVDDSPPTSPPPEPTSAPALPTEIPPTSTPSASPTPEPSVVKYEDPEGDCLNNANVPTACSPLGVDILTVTISEASPLTIIMEVAEPGFEELRAGGIFGVTHGIDLDRDPTTGNTSFWPEFHLLGPDIEVHWFEENGEVVAEGVTFYAPDGTMTEGDASLAVWTVLDDTHIQVVLSDELVDSPSVAIAGDLFTPALYDHFVDGGHVTFPEGEVNSSE